MDNVLEELRESGIPACCDILNYRRQSIKKKQDTTISDKKHDTNISDKPPTTVVVTWNDSSKPVDEISIIRDVSIHDISEITDPIVQKPKKRGRPMGTSMKARIHGRTGTDTRNFTKNGFLSDLIARKWDEYGLSKIGWVPVSCDTIRSRIFKASNMFATHRGSLLPLHEIEPTICETLIQMGKI